MDFNRPFIRQRRNEGDRFKSPYSMLGSQRNGKWGAGRKKVVSSREHSAVEKFLTPPNWVESKSKKGGGKKRAKKISFKNIKKNI
jgi:hypothetical protein